MTNGLSLVPNSINLGSDCVGAKLTVRDYRQGGFPNPIIGGLTVLA